MADRLYQTPQGLQRMYEPYEGLPVVAGRTVPESHSLLPKKRNTDVPRYRVYTR